MEQQLGVETVAESVGVTGYDRAGYVNVSTSDDVVHGQVNQSSLFSFVRIYQAGHAVGVFQPLLLQTIFARTVAGLDVATGELRVDNQYRTTGPSNSTYLEGNATVQDHPWSVNATYNYTSNLPTLKDFQPFWDGPLQGECFCLDE